MTKRIVAYPTQISFNRIFGSLLCLKFKCTAILIGSYARGDFNLWSDIDILIIGDFQGNPLQRLKNIDFPPGYATIFLTMDEVNKLKSKNSKFIKDAFNDGIILRDDYLLFSSNSKEFYKKCRLQLTHR